MTTIALLASFAPSLTNFRGDLIRALAGRGMRVLALAPDHDGESRKALAALGAEPVDVPLSRAGLNPLEDLKTLRALSRVLGDLKPDVLVPYTIKPVIWGTLAARKAGIDHVVPMITGLGYAFMEGRGLKERATRAIAQWLYRLALSRADHVIFQNPDDRDLMRARAILPEHVPASIVNGSGIDCAAFTPAAMPSAPSFLMISRFLVSKGVGEYCRAGVALKKAFPEVAVRLAGYPDVGPDGIPAAELEESFAGGVEHLGRLSDVRGAIADTSVYVLPSYREGTPRTVLEAMAMGRAIITTDAPGCRETVIEGENGLLVPVQDVDALVEAMRRFVLDPGLAGPMGRHSRRIAEEKYDVHRVNDAVLGIIEAELSRPR